MNQTRDAADQIGFIARRVAEHEISLKQGLLEAVTIIADGRATARDAKRDTGDAKARACAHWQNLVEHTTDRRTGTCVTSVGEFYEALADVLRHQRQTVDPPLSSKVRRSGGE